MTQSIQVDLCLCSTPPTPFPWFTVATTYVQRMYRVCLIAALALHLSWDRVQPIGGQLHIGGSNVSGVHEIRRIPDHWAIDSQALMRSARGGALLLETAWEPLQPNFASRCHFLCCLFGRPLLSLIKVVVVAVIVVVAVGFDTSASGQVEVFALAWNTRLPGK